MLYMSQEYSLTPTPTISELTTAVITGSHSVFSEYEFGKMLTLSLSINSIIQERRAIARVTGPGRKNQRARVSNARGVFGAAVSDEFDRADAGIASYETNRSRTAENCS